MVLEAWHGILYGLAGMAWYMIRPGEVWHGMWKCLCEFHVLWHCLGLWSRSHVERPMSNGSPVHTYRKSCSHVQDTSRGIVTCMLRSHVQLLFTLGSESKLKDCENIYHCSGIEFSTVTFIVC